MRITGINGSTVEVVPVSYELLVIAGTVVTPSRTWTFQDPCLTTFEAAELTTWLRHVAAGHVDVNPLAADGTIEPDLCFSEPLARQSRGTFLSVGTAEYWSSDALPIQSTALVA